MAEASETTSKPRSDTFYDASFAIEAIQHEPYENGFTWRTVVGALFVAFVMLPGTIFMGLMIGADLGTAADWVTIILFVELARRSFVTLRKQELFILKYTVGSLSHIAGGLALGGGIFAYLVFNRFLRNSEAFNNFGIANEVPDWFAPLGDAAYRSFLDSVWWPIIAVTVGSMLLSKLTELSLGFLAYKLTADVERLPFPLAPIHAEGAIALAERSTDTHKKGFRQYCFAIGVMIGAAFGLVYVAVPILSKAFLDKPIQLLPIPFWDLTASCEEYIPGGMIGLTLNLGLIFTGFVLPWRIAVGATVTSLAVQLVVNPLLQTNGLLPSWKPGKDAIETQVAATVDVYLSLGIGTALAIFLVGLLGLVKSWIKYARARRETLSAEEPVAERRGFFIRDVARGDPPTWVALAVWLTVSIGFVMLSDHLINTQNGVRVPADKQFPIGWLLAFAFLVSPVNTYVNARMVGISGQHASVPFVFESSIFISGYKYVNIWFAPMPLFNYGGFTDTLRVCQLTRTKFTSILKAELLVFPLMMAASFIFWSYITSLGPIPSDSYPQAQKFWPQAAQMKALWASSMKEGQSLLVKAIKPEVIAAGLAGVTCLFGLFGAIGISTQYIYGGLAALNGLPHSWIMIFIGACLGRFVLARRFGREKWTNYAPILAVGFGVGIGLVGMLCIAINFLWVSIGTSG